MCVCAHAMPHYYFELPTFSYKHTQILREYLVICSHVRLPLPSYRRDLKFPLNTLVPSLQSSDAHQDKYIYISLVWPP